MSVRERLLRILLAGGLLGVAAAVYWFVVGGGAPPPREDRPAQAPASRSSAGLVGTARCVQCHEEQARDHALSGHSRTFHRTLESPVAMSLCGKSVPAADGYHRFVYECDDEGLMVGIPDLFGGRLFPLDFALGSGDHAVTFLSLQPNLDGDTVGIEHRMTWYRSRDALGLTPSHDTAVPQVDIEYFGRMHTPEVTRNCIDCHTTAFSIVNHRLVDFVGGVQCEACHGPGEGHAAAAARGDADLRGSIRVPRTARDEIDLCGRCHRLPETFDPDRLQRYPPSLTRFQPVGLSFSACFQQSGGDLRCTTCHNPHGPVSAESEESHVAACRNCHNADRASLCRAAHTTGCIQCHMRKLELIPGIFFHDHWIRTRPPEIQPDEDAATSNVDLSVPPAP